MKRPLAYITASWSADEIENTEAAAKYCRSIYDAGFAPVCSQRASIRKGYTAKKEAAFP